ncbi:GNAT family N-acetyltransferase [Nanohaloarchaea archaeon H01]|nr:GNAT family N-acetyltransferase [Nanohaloarchaea archaeon H01]
MPGKVFLEGDKVNLRTIEEEDIDFLTEVNNPNVWEWLGSVSKPQNREQQKQFFENAICSDEEVHLAISKEEEMKGIISLIPKDDATAKIGLWIAEEFHGNGYGTEASKIVVDYAFGELRYHKVFARSEVDNKGSKRIWEKLGFQEEGELREQSYREGEFQNILVYGVLEDEWD